MDYMTTIPMRCLTPSSVSVYTQLASTHSGCAILWVNLLIFQESSLFRCTLKNPYYPLLRFYSPRYLDSPPLTKFVRLWCAQTHVLFKQIHLLWPPVEDHTPPIPVLSKALAYRPRHVVLRCWIYKETPWGGHGARWWTSCQRRAAEDHRPRRRRCPIQTFFLAFLPLVQQTST